MELRPVPRAPSIGRATLWIAAKELRAAFRDRQTTLYAIVLPIALYPFLFWCMIQASMFVQGRRERTEVEVGLAAARDARVPAELHAALATSASVEEADEGRRARLERVNRVHVGALRAPLDESAAREWAAERARVGAAQGSEDAPDAVVWMPALPPADDALGDARDAATTLTVFYDSTQTASELARRRVTERLPPLVDRLRAEKLAPGTPRTELEPFRLATAHNVAERKDQGAYVLSFVLPMLLVVMCVLGAFFPAVDVTAGERERNTAETTMLLPVPRLAVHQGKILAVCASAMLATVLNLFALALSAGHLLQMLPHESTVQIELPVAAFLAIAPLALLFAFFVSAALVGIASFARTFKEGQALLGPVQMVFILPAMAGAIPGLQLTPGLACVPVVNVVLAFRALLNREALPLEYAITAVVLLATAVLAIAVAVRLLAREALFAPEGRRGLAACFSSARGGAR
ncbi:MAG: ABC transporter permease [Planctomycetes bacterium]|nr:ABC transporter permease [Planctomycetota bacterium]